MSLPLLALVSFAILAVIAVIILVQKIEGRAVSRERAIVVTAMFLCVVAWRVWVVVKMPAGTIGWRDIAGIGLPFFAAVVFSTFAWRKRTKDGESGSRE